MADWYDEIARAMMNKDKYAWLSFSQVKKLAKAGGSDKAKLLNYYRTWKVVWNTSWAWASWLYDLYKTYKSWWDFSSAYEDSLTDQNRDKWRADVSPWDMEGLHKFQEDFLSWRIWRSPVARPDFQPVWVVEYDTKASS